MTLIFMNSYGFPCIGYDFYVLVLILEVALDFYSLVMISTSLPGFLRLCLDGHGLVWLLHVVGIRKGLYKKLF